MGLMQRGLRTYKGVFMVTIFEGAHISAACLSGDVVMSEMSDATWSRWIGYWSSIGIIVAGIALVSYASTDAEMAVRTPPSVLVSVHAISRVGSSTRSGNSGNSPSSVHTAVLS